MSNNVVWFEVTGQDADKLQRFYSNMFGWKFEAAPSMPSYGMIPRPPEGQAGIPGGVGGAITGAAGWVTFYVDVDDIEAAVARAGEQGSQVIQPPTPLPDGSLIAVISDPEGRPLGLVQTPKA